jgi:error-prone DNA polymerase
MTAPAYAELQVTTNFCFLRGGSHPHELVEQASGLGLSAIGVTDRNSVAGMVRAHLAAREMGLRLVVGCRLDFQGGSPSLLVYPTDRAAYGRLSRLLTLGKGRAVKGECLLDYHDLLDFGEGQIVVALAPAEITTSFREALARIKADFPGRSYLALSRRFGHDDAKRLARLAALGDSVKLPLLATNDVLYHMPERRPLQDVLTCIRHTCTIDEAGLRLNANAERHLKSPREMARLFADYPQALASSLEIVERCDFSLIELTYEYPEEIAPDGEAPQDRLIRLTWEGAAWRYPEGIPAGVKEQLEKELRIIGELNYAPFFLTVQDIVQYATREGILNQGRGSAANSAVCYVLGITGVDPALGSTLFERFISASRNEPPDIDVDFEHERREDVIQYIYDRYGRHRAGLTATVICYRTRGAVREVGKAFGLSPDITAALSGSVWGWSVEGIPPERLAEIGLDASDRRLAMTLKLSQALIGFPRHLSQHPGGFVITRGRLDEMAPIENAAMEKRTMICWDKDDIESLGMLKVDVLALGMLTAIAKAFKLVEAHYPDQHQQPLNLATVPKERPEVYEMLSRADSIGVFQVESRAQQTMLPRLKPKEFYDLVVEVAIVRPGPIQGGMVHPYLRRRRGHEKPDYPSEALRPILEKTLGVPLFQEQCMKIVIVGAGFAPARADELRRAMATFKKVGTIHQFRTDFIKGMLANGYEKDFAERCFSQIEGFGTYGFPESHAASFALLVYVSAWLKWRYPDVFCCALLNSQPMGFYAPAQLIRDAREHGVPIRPIDVNHSVWDHTLEPGENGRCALRLGLRLVAGLKKAEAGKLIEARRNPYASPAELMHRARLTRSAMLTLAQADAFGSMDLERRQALWTVMGLEDNPLPLFAALSPVIVKAPLPTMPDGQSVAEDYVTLGLSLKRHPMTFLRGDLARKGLITAEMLRTAPNNRRVTIAGLVLFRQRPATASGTIFITLEDETGSANLIVWPSVSEKFRRAVFGAKLLACTGTLQREDQVIHVIAKSLTDWSGEIYKLHEGADSFALRFGRGDEVSSGGGDDGRRPRAGSAVMQLKSRDFR